MKLRIYRNLAVLNENDKIVFFIPEPGIASISEFEAPTDFNERIRMAQEVVDMINADEKKSE